MQKTIDHIITNFPERVGEINELGDPETIELLSNDGNVDIRYYIFK